LDSNVEAGAVEGFKEDLGCIFSILWWVERLNPYCEYRFGLEAYGQTLYIPVR